MRTLEWPRFVRKADLEAVAELARSKSPSQMLVKESVEELHIEMTEDLNLTAEEFVRLVHSDRLD
jgi:hypothetical protein